MKHIKELDGVRALAALMVMWFHFFQHYPATNSVTTFIQKTAVFGQTGVSLFFVLSGFLITRILLYTKDKDNYFKNFYARRALRIFPLYYLFLIIYYIIIPLIYNSDFIIPGVITGHLVNINQQIYYWTYLQGFAISFKWPNEGPNHYWSLAVEEHFYLFWPILVFLIQKRNVIFLCIIAIASSIMVRILLNEHGYDTFYFTYARFDELALGSVLALAELFNLLESKYNTKYRIFLLLFLGPLILFWRNLSGSSSAILEITKPLLLGIVYFAFLASIITANRKNLINKVFRSKPLVFMGTISYGLYIYHEICFVLFRYYVHLNNFVVELIFSFLIVTLVSFLSYHLFESKFLHLKKYFT